MTRKGVKFEIELLSSSSPCSGSHISLTGALRNTKLGREMKLCDPTNIGMFKSM